MEPVEEEARGSVASTPVIGFLALKTTQGQMDGFFSKLPYKCHLEEVAAVGD